MGFFGFKTAVGQTGDTIVEVLIAVGIISMVLASAYAVTNRNARISFETQEQMYGQKLAEEQTELLRTITSVPGIGCFDATGAYVVAGAHSASCERTNGGARYGVSIQGTGTHYTVTVDWDKLGGGTVKVTMLYWTAG